MEAAFAEICLRRGMRTFQRSCGRRRLGPGRRGRCDFNPQAARARLSAVTVALANATSVTGARPCAAFDVHAEAITSVGVCTQFNCIDVL